LGKFGSADDIQQRECFTRADVARIEAVKEARELIYKDNYAVESAPIKHLLDHQSLVPVQVSGPLLHRYNLLKSSQNAFSARLSTQGFNIHAALVVDFLHEVELGVWKDLFSHLLRILYAIDSALVSELDRR
jgi:hypothetical protein